MSEKPIDQGVNESPRKLKCAICLHEANSNDPKTIILNCGGGCFYHDECLESVFLVATKRRDCFPAMCNCRIVIDQDSSVRGVIGERVRESYDEKRDAYLDGDRLYCQGNDSQVRIPPNKTSNMAGQCFLESHSRKTCVKCGKEAHDGGHGEDDDDEEFVKLCEKQGWQKCGHCGQWVEHWEGCNDLECRCGFRFCFVCGNPSGSSSCECGWPPTHVTEMEEALRIARLAQTKGKDRRNGQSANPVDAATCLHSAGFEGLKGAEVCEECKAMSSDSYQCWACSKVACYDCFRKRPHRKDWPL